MAQRIKAWALSMFCCASVSPALAQDFLNPTNAYVSVNAGLSKSKDTCTTTLYAGASCSENGVVYRLAYGYNFTPTWGMELSYGDFGVVKEKGTMPSTPIGVPGSGPIPYEMTWDAVGFELAGTVTLYLGDSFSLIAKVGAYHAMTGLEIEVITSTNELWHAVAHEDSSGTSVGLAAQYDFNRDFALRLQYQNFGEIGSTSKVKVSAATAGLVLKF